MPIYRIETDQGTFRIDADQEPTPEEALQAISQQSSVAQPKTQGAALQRDFPQMGRAVNPVAPTLGQDILSAIPLYGSPTAFREGQAAGQELLGQNLAGDILGALAGTGRAIGTIFNPVAKGLGYTAPTAQAIGSLAAGDTQQAIRDLTGQTEVLPGVEEAQTSSTLGNLILNAANAVRRDPANTIPMIAGGVALARAPRATVSGLATGLESAGRTAGRGILSGAEVAGEALAAPVSGIANLVETASTRGFRAPLEDVVVNATGIPAIEGGIEIAQTALNRIVEKTGKLPSRSVGRSQATIKQADKAQKALVDEAQSYLKDAGEQGLVIDETVGINTARDLVRDRFQLATADEGVLNAIFDKPEFRNLKQSVSPLETQKHLTEFNTKYQAFEDKTSPDALAYRTVRDYLSDQVDSAVKVQSGKDISPWRDWGAVEEFKTGLSNQIRQAQESQAGRTPAGPGVPFTPKGAVVKAVRAVGGRPFIPRQIEAIDSGLKRLESNYVKKSSPRDLTTEEIQALRSGLIPRPPVIGQGGPRVPPPNLERLIEQRMRTYPKNIRDSGLARYAAESQLAEEGLIPPQ